MVASCTRRAVKRVPMETNSASGRSCSNAAKAAPIKSRQDLLAVRSFSGGRLIIFVELILKVFGRLCVGGGLIVEHVHLTRVLVDDGIARHFLGALS